MTLPDPSALSDDELRAAVSRLLADREEDRRENQILWYQPAQKRGIDVHRSQAGIIGIGGGNRSSKTETALAELVALATGMLPYEPDVREALLAKFRGPINCRVVIESLKNTLHSQILTKFQWWKWQGLRPPGGQKGHWGWVPRCCLMKDSWEKSWKEGDRMLKLLCRDPEEPNRILGESMVQFMSHDQDWSDFASGSFDIVIHDEPPNYMIWKENLARVLDVDGRMFLVMTWPDDPAIAVDWIFDEVYERGRPGPGKDPSIDWFEFQTLDNRYLDRKVILAKTAGWSEQTKLVKLKGQPIRFSNRIHPLFTDTPLWWSYAAGKVVEPDEIHDEVSRETVRQCPETGSADVVEFCHVQEFEASTTWPTAFILDPHPRKAHMGLWVQVDPADDLWVVAEIAVDGDAPDVRDAVEAIEAAMGLQVRLRIMDPNMGRSPTASRDITWQDEFDRAGLHCELADNSDVGRAGLNKLLEPDTYQMQPRIKFHPRCQTCIWQLKRYVWDDWKQVASKAQKQKPREKNDDFPTMLKYLKNWQPTFAMLADGAPVLRTRRVA